MKYSEHFRLFLPEGNDFVSPEPFNQNFQTIEGKLWDVEKISQQFSGHTHDAGDISGGVLDKNRVPTLGNWWGTSEVFWAGVQEQEIEVSSGKSYNYEIKFSTIREKRPERLLAIFGSNGAELSLQSGNAPLISFVDMSYDKEENCVGQMGAYVKEGSNGASGVYFATIPVIFPNFSDGDIFNYTCYFKSTKNGYSDWSGIGGGAFFKSTISPPSSHSGENLVNFSVGNFQFDKEKLSFVIKTPDYSRVNSATVSVTLKFSARLYFWD